MAEKAIGPNFCNELAAANLFGLPFSWSDDGTIEYGAAMTDEQKTAVAAVYAAHDPAKVDPIAAADALLAGGVTITSASTPAANGTYGCTGADQQNITSLQVAVTANVFPGYLRDKSGTAHTMTAAVFTTLAEALLAFVVAVDQAKATALAPAGSWVAPATAVAIA